MREEIPLLNHFLFILSEQKQHTPKSYLLEVYARINSLGYGFELPKDSELSGVYGDIYILMDRWGDALDPQTNQLEKRFGEKYYINLVWFGGGQEIIAHVLTEDDVELDSTGLDY